MSYLTAFKIIDSNNVPQGVLMENNTLTSRDYLIAVGEGDVAAHKRFEKIGFTPTLATGAGDDVWSAAGVYVFPTAAARWRIAAGGATDLGTVIKGNAEGANQAILCDPTGDLVTLRDVSVDFSAATAVAVGDCILLDPKGASPEWGYVTDITNAATGVLGIAGGFSSGGSCATARAYTIVDLSGAVGAQVIKIDYLTNLYAEKTILVCLNGGTAVSFADATGAALTDTFRVNSFRIIAAGSTNALVAACSLQLNAAPNTVYSYITAGYTRARNSVYTVPASKELYVNKIIAGYAVAAAAKWDYARMWLRANREPTTGFLTGNIFYPYTEILTYCSSMMIPLLCPLKFVAKTDLKMSGMCSTAGVAISTIRGWLETV